MTAPVAILGLVLALFVRSPRLRRAIWFVVAACSPGWLAWMLVGLLVLNLVRRSYRWSPRGHGAEAAALLQPERDPQADEFGGQDDELSEIDPDSLARMEQVHAVVAAIPSIENLVGACRELAWIRDVSDPARPQPPLVVAATERLIARSLVERGFSPGTRRFVAAAATCRRALSYARDERRTNLN